MNHESHEDHEKDIKNNERADLVLAPESYEIMGACFAVYSEMGCGCPRLEFYRFVADSRWKSAAGN
jgi:hypothetical protein